MTQDPADQIQILKAKRHLRGEMWLRRSPVIPKFEALRRSTQCPWMLYSSTSYSDTPIKEPKLAPLQERKMIDRFRLWAKGGDGGNGCCSVRRSRSERQGTPDGGGSGGRGGDVILECSPKVWDFRNLQHHMNAKRGGHGAPKNMIGSRGMDKVVLVPVGTVIHLVDGETPVAVENRSLKPLDPWEIPGALEVNFTDSNQLTKSNSSNAAEDLNIEEMDVSTSTLKRSNGGSTSMSKTWRTSSTEYRTASSYSVCQPSINKEELISHSEIGETENKDLENTEIETELDEDNMEEQVEIQYNVAELTKQGQRVLVARGGDGGRGNVSFGKHSKFRSKVSDDEDQPSLSIGLPGSESVLVLELKSIADVGLVGMPNAVTVADIPGIIKGAHENRGLGHAFLRHIERTKVLAYVVDLAAALDGKKGIPPWEQLRDLVLELEFHREGLSDRPSLVVANKIDEDGTEDVLEELKIRVQGVPIFPVCAVLGEGVLELKDGLRSLVNGGEYQKLELDKIDVE
ncbi:hypothetical protein C5167_002974 [Papaver somniferum]|uniref:OBG-type G domain-containing protein n=1 Tax=Papaver somniferum TaxID=3469 RepID=A0A4Y7L3J2_PAPSO|nr:hypothetical protein C5167_002974 [Papaver somniferum]